jgi:hypothetical protein
VNIQWDIWDEECFEFWSLEEALQKIKRRRQKYKDPYTIYKFIDDIREYDELKKVLENKPQDVTVTLKVDTAKLDQKELDILVSLLKGAEIKVTIDGTKINDLQSLLSLAKKAEKFSARIDITDDVYNQLSS